MYQHAPGRPSDVTHSEIAVRLKILTLSCEFTTTQESEEGQQTGRLHKFVNVRPEESAVHQITQTPQ